MILKVQKEKKYKYIHAGKEEKMRIMFVCTGNTCRSAMADGYFSFLIGKAERKDLFSCSCGLAAGNGLPANPNSVKIAEKYSFSLAEHKAVSFTKELGEKADLILCMTSSHKEMLLAVCPALAEKTGLLSEYGNGGGRDVADPFGGSLQVYEKCFLEMKKYIDDLFLDLLNKKNK